MYKNTTNLHLFLSNGKFGVKLGAGACITLEYFYPPR